MANPEFPHLDLTFKGAFDPHYNGGSSSNAEVISNRENPSQHAQQIKGIIDGMRISDERYRRRRNERNLPPIPAERGFLLRIPENADADAIANALGVELVSETEEGIMLVSTSDLSHSRIYEVLEAFGAGTGNLTTGSTLLDVYHEHDDQRKLVEVLAPEVLSIWPFENDTLYTFDLSIQTATSTRDFSWPSIRRRNSETESGFYQRRERARNEARFKAEDRWQDNAEARVRDLDPIVNHYEGKFLSGIISEEGIRTESGMVFSDSVQVRVKMNGEGFRDVVMNFSHLFEVSVPPELQSAFERDSTSEESEAPNILPPPDDAPSVCVVDSGIQEQHLWLSPAVDSASSRCFLPDREPNDVADYVYPKGHGTRVAGRVLYPIEVPKNGEVQSTVWIQNARVLNDDNSLPETLPPEVYLQRVVEHFHRLPRLTKIFNHSINAGTPCPRRRMTAWAAKIDELSHGYDVLFIQSAGNQNQGSGNQANPGLTSHLLAGRTPPEHHLEDSMRIANPAQSLHALTVGSVSEITWQDGNRRSFANQEMGPSGFSRSGFGQPWSVTKPEVVEIGGDLIYSTPPPIVSPHPDVSVELVNSTRHGQSAISKDGIGTSFSAPKVAHLAAILQRQFPNSSPLLYRALIAQSARWPDWAESEPNKDSVLRMVGFGIPSIDRATSNADTRVTLITPDAEVLPSKKLHLYTIKIPDSIRNAAHEAKLRIDVTLAYTAQPRRTRARRTHYLETWLDWEASRFGEDADVFLNRMENGGRGEGQNIPWTLHTATNRGGSEETTRGRGTLQKDWAVFDSYELPDEFSIAVRAHLGWNHRNTGGQARYCLAVTLEALDVELPLYSEIEAENRIELEPEIRTENH